jgi:hypothetical protein
MRRTITNTSNAINLPARCAALQRAARRCKRTVNKFSTHPKMASNLKPDRHTATVPAELTPLMKRRMEDEHYPSMSNYLLGLILFDIYCRRKHKLTAPLFSEPPWVREKVVSQIIEDFKNGVRTGRAAEEGWFEKRLKQLIDEARREGKNETS